MATAAVTLWHRIFAALFLLCMCCYLTAVSVQSGFKLRVYTKPSSRNDRTFCQYPNCFSCVGSGMMTAACMTQHHPQNSPVLDCSVSRNHNSTRALPDHVFIRNKMDCSCSATRAPAPKVPQHKLVIAVGCGVSTKGIDASTIDDLPLVKTFATSLMPTLQPKYTYRLYFAYDHNDPLLATSDWKAAITSKIQAMVANEESKRKTSWHHTSVDPGTIAALDVKVCWVLCEYSGKPSWAHNDAMMAAFLDGADYGYRTNDDSMFPKEHNWVELFVTHLNTRQPVPNLGVVGPSSNGNTAILTHDFVHRTHVCIFGFYYPRSLPDWSSDDWIDHVYRGFNLSHKMKAINVVHTLNPMRYVPSGDAIRSATLRREVEDGTNKIKQFTQEQCSVQLG